MSDEQFEVFFAFAYGYAYSPFNNHDTDGKHMAHLFVQQMTPVAQKYYGYGYDKHIAEMREFVNSVKGMDIHLQKKLSVKPAEN